MGLRILYIYFFPIAEPQVYDTYDKDVKRLCFYLSIYLILEGSAVLGWKLEITKVTVLLYYYRYLPVPTG